MYDAEGAAYRRRQSRRFLTQVNAAKRHIEALAEDVDEIRVMASGLRGIDYSRDTVSTIPSDDSITNAVASIFDAIEERVELVRDCTSMFDACDTALKAMGGARAALLRAHYCNGISLADAGSMMGYSADWVYRLRDAALEEFYDYIPSSYRDPRHPAI